MMDKARCSSIRDSLLAAFADQLEVSATDTQCIVTLPLKTVDDRFIDVFVEPTLGSFVYVHDGGKNTAELFSQGIHLTDRQTELLKELARRYGVMYQNGRFQVACPTTEAVYSAIFAVSQCASLAMIEVVAHQPIIEDEPISARVARSLHKWQPEYVDIKRRFMVKGKQIGAEHMFDFVSISSDKSRARNVALKILPPSFGAHDRTSKKPCGGGMSSKDSSPDPIFGPEDGRAPCGNGHVWSSSDCAYRAGEWDWPCDCGQLSRDFPPDELEAPCLIPAGHQTWQPIETAPKEEVCWFWVRPKTAEESYLDTSGNSIFVTGPPRAWVGKYECWCSLDTATHWMPYRVPEPPV